MPTSYHHQISKILDLIIHLNPKSVLDVGVGFGKYGVLCREYLELWGHDSNYGKFTRRIDGIEGFPGYLTPLHSYIYDHIYTGDALEVVDELKAKYDLVLLIDVLEHFEKKDGRMLLKKLLKKGKGVLISTPKEEHPQEDAFGNPFETHRSVWSKSDLSVLGDLLVLQDSESWIVYLGKAKDVAQVKRSYAMAKTKEKLAKIPFLVSMYRRLKSG